MNLARCGVRRFLHGLAALSLLTAFAAGAQDSGPAAPGIDTPTADVSAVAGDPIELQVVTTRGGAAASGERVVWTLEDPDSGRIEALDARSRAAGDGVAAGSARARFTPAGPGRHGITVQMPVDPACTGSDCRMFARRVVVAAAAPAGSTGSAGIDGKAALLIAGGGAAALALLASDGDGGDEAPGARIGIISGNGQSALAGNPLPQPLVVETRTNGRVAAGAVIVWTATGGATLSAGHSTADAAGRAAITVTSVGPGPGPITITAARQDDPLANVVFTAAVNIAGLDKVSGDGQTTPVDTTTALPLVVRTTLNGSPQAGVAVTWQVLGGGTLSGTTSTSNGSGLAQTFVDVGSFPGPITVVVTRNDQPGATQSFTINAVELRDLVIISGDGQTVPQGQPAPAPLAVRALDNGAGDGGVPIFWSASGGATLSSNNTTTDPAGFSNVTVTSMGFGLDPVTVTATRGDVPSLSVTFTLNVDPPSLTIVSGDGQSGLAGTTAPAPIQAQLLDGAGAPMAGQMVSWSVVSGDAQLTPPVSTTDAAGIASVNLTFGNTTGPITIEASAFSGGVTANASATSQAPGGLTPAGGDGQSGAPNTLLPTPLTVDIGSPTAGVPVTFAVVSGQATVTTPNAVTDALGQASTTVTLGGRPGPVVVRATAPGGVTYDFNLTITGTVIVTGTTAVSGNTQDLTIGVPSAPMKVKLVDTATNTPIAGVTVHWSTTNGTMNTPTTVTDANGETTNTVTISSAGPAVVTASFPTAGTYDGSSVVFNHNGPLAAVPNLLVNEASVAEALDSACGALSGGGPLTPDQQDLLDQCTALAAASGSDPAAVSEALTAMLPDVAQTQADAGQAAVGAQFENLNGRIVQLRSGAPMAKVSFSGLNLAMAGGQVPLATIGSLLMDADPAQTAVEDSGFAKWGFFVSGNIGRGESDPTSLTPEYDFDVNGLTAGVDYRWSDSLVLGMALGYTSQDTDLANAQGGVETRGFSLSMYTTWYTRSEWYLDGVMTFSRNDYDHERRIQYVLPGQVVNQIAEASSDGNDFSATLTFGRDWQIRGWSLGAYARAQYNHLSFDSFEETVDSSLPGSGLALAVESRSVGGFSMNLGGKVAYAHSTSWGVLIPQFEVEWQNDFQSDAEAFRGYFLDDPTGTPILVVGEDLDSNYFRVGLGMSMVLTGGRSGFITYESVVGRSGISQDMLSLGFRWEF